MRAKADWTVQDGKDGTDPRPWVWWSTGEKDASWQIGVAVNGRGKQVAGEIEDPRDKKTTVIENICENPGSATGLQNAVLIVEAVNAWNDPKALRARLARLDKKQS